MYKHVPGGHGCVAESAIAAAQKNERKVDLLSYSVSLHCNVEYSSVCYSWAPTSSLMSPSLLSSMPLLLEGGTTTTGLMLPQDIPTNMLTVRGHLMPSLAGVSTSMDSFSRPCVKPSHEQKQNTKNSLILIKGFVLKAVAQAAPFTFNLLSNAFVVNLKIIGKKQVVVKQHDGLKNCFHMCT